MPANRADFRARLVTDIGPQVADEYVYKVVDALDEVAQETSKTVPQVALNWLRSAAERGQRHHRSPERGTTEARTSGPSAGI